MHSAVCAVTDCPSVRPSHVVVKTDERMELLFGSETNLYH